MKSRPLEDVDVREGNLHGCFMTTFLVPDLPLRIISLEDYQSSVIVLAVQQYLLGSNFSKGTEHESTF